MRLHGIITSSVAAALGMLGSLVPALAAPPAATRTGPVGSAQVYATREGLVGRVTANGHVIRPRDHFVALPSIRVLSPRGTGQFSVRVCAGARCVYEPVWDIGPWNVGDDFWSGPRAGLAAGVPEAQAAYVSGYHAGQDQFGRQVRNPAGIDLADGALWDGLGLTTDITQVRVDLLWQGEGTRGRVITGDGGPLRVRGGPGTGTPVVGMAGGYARLPIQCRAPGETIAGPAGTSNLWDRVGPGNYVSDAYVLTDPGVRPPAC